MKRIIGLSLLFFANLVILAHAVVPHHHHDRVIVSICSILSIDDALNHKHENCHSRQHNEHEHSGHSLNEDCISNKLYVRSISSVNSDDAGIPHLNLDFPIICYDVNNQIRELSNSFLPFRQKPYLNAYHTHYITRSLGLRAPPSC